MILQVDALAAIEEREDRSIHHWLPKLLDQIERHAELSGTIGVEKARIGVQARQQEDSLHLAVEHTIAVVQAGVDRVVGAPMDPPWLVVDLEEE